MSKVVALMSMSLDGYVADPDAIHKRGEAHYGSVTARRAR